MTARRSTAGSPAGGAARKARARSGAGRDETLLASIVDSSDDAIIGKALDGTITSWNPAAERLYGYAAGEIVGRPISLLIPPTRADEMARILERINRGEHVEQYETSRLRKDGHEVPISLKVSPISDAEGQVVGASSIARDITDRNRRLSLLASIVDSSEDAIIGKALDGTITSWNPAAERLYGYEASEILGRPVSMLMSHDRADEMTRILERISHGERMEHYETVRLRKDGREVPISLTVSPIRDGSGHVIGASSIARDITERNRADEERRAAAQYARSLIEASLDPLVTISPEGKVTDVNEATIKVTGVSREKLIGTDFSDYFTEPEEARKGYQRVFAEGSVTDYPLTIRHRDGQLTDVVYNASVYRDVGGQVLGVFAAARDVTAQKRAEAEIAEQRARELDRLSELERFQKLTVGRELKMIELKKEIEEMKRLVPAESAPRP